MAQEQFLSGQEQGLPKSFVSEDDEETVTPKSFVPEEPKKKLPTESRGFLSTIGKMYDSLTSPLPKRKEANLPSESEVEDAARTFEGKEPKKKEVTSLELKTQEKKPIENPPADKKSETNPELRRLSGQSEDEQKRISQGIDPRVKAFGEKVLFGTSPELEEEKQKAGITDIKGPGMMEVPGVRQATDYLANKITGSEGNLRLGAGALTKAFGDILGSGVDPRTVGTGPEKPFGFDEFRAEPIEPNIKQIGSGYSEGAVQPRKLLTAGEGAEPIDPELSLRRARNLPPDLAAPGEEGIFNAKRAEDIVKPVEQSIYEKARAKTGGRELPDELAVSRRSPEESARILGDEISIQPKSFVPEVVEKEAPKSMADYAMEAANDMERSGDIEGARQQRETIARMQNEETPKTKLAEKTKFKNPFEKPPSFEPAGVIGPYKDLSPETLVHEVTHGDKPSAILENVPDEKIDDLIETARINGLAVIRNPISENEPIIAKNNQIGEQLARSLDEGDHETTGKLLGYKDRDISAFMEKMASQEPQFARSEQGGIKIGANIKRAAQKVTVKNAPPNQRAKMFRGAHEPVDIIFQDSNDKEIFGSGQRGFSKDGTLKVGITERIIRASNMISNKYNLTTKQAMNLIIDYNKEIRSQGSKIDKNGGSLDAPTFEEFIKNKVGEREGIMGESGALRVSRKKKEPTPATGPYASALDKLFNALGKISENRVSQDIINKAERAKRFAGFAGVKTEGMKGAAESLGKLRGEFEKVDTEKLGLDAKETDSLFTAIKKARITEGEKARGYTALFKLLNGEAVPVRSELKILDDVFGNNFASKIVEMHGGLGSIGFKLTKTANTMKALRSSIDLSAPLRQGLGLIHRPEYREAFMEMFKYFKDKEYFNDAMSDIEKRPLYLLGREAGLFLAKSDEITGGEEAFMNNYLHNVPKFTGIPMATDASERAYVGFLNKLRADTFDNLIAQAKSSGAEPYKITKGEDGEVNVTPTDVARNIAKYVNVSTGRGSLGRFEKIAPELNAAIWSPKLLSARLSVLNPKYYMSLDAFTRKQAIKSLFAIAAAGVTIGALGKLAGGKVSGDITSADFGKVRLKSGNVVDQWGGFQQPVVAAARMIAEVNRMAKGERRGYNQPSIPEIGGRFMENKLAPMASLAYEIATMSKWTGNEAKGDITTLGIPQYGGFTNKYGGKKYLNTEIINQFKPMFIQDVSDVLKSDPDFAEQIGLDTASLFGVGVQSYPEKKDKPFRSLGIQRLRP